MGACGNALKQKQTVKNERNASEGKEDDFSKAPTTPLNNILRCNCSPKKEHSYLLFLLSFFFFFLFTNETSSIIHYLPLNLPFYFFLDSLVFLLCYQFSDGPITATILAKNINIHASKSNDTRKYIFLSCFGGAGLVIIYIMSAMF